MLDLNTLIPPGSNLQLVMATSIDDHGEIGGQGVDPNGDNHAFLLTPCDEHHPGVEGCDYSMVDAIPVTQVGPASRDVFSGTRRLFPPSRTNRFRFPGIAIGSRN
jgi:hypothetical protein